MLEEYDHSRCTHLIAKHCKSDLFDQVTHCTCHTMHTAREVCMVHGDGMVNCMMLCPQPVAVEPVHMLPYMVMFSKCLHK